MRQLSFEITVPGQVTGSAQLNTFILDGVSVAPERRRPVILVCPGGGYRIRSDREREPIVTQFLTMGYHVCVLEYSVGTNRFPVAVMDCLSPMRKREVICRKRLWNSARAGFRW